MKCHICNAALSSPRYNRDLQQWEPCGTCLEVISDCLNDLKDNAVFVEEDENVGALVAQNSPT